MQNIIQLKVDEAVFISIEGALVKFGEGVGHHFQIIDTFAQLVGDATASLQLVARGRRHGLGDGRCWRRLRRLARLHQLRTGREEIDAEATELVLKLQTTRRTRGRLNQQRFPLAKTVKESSSSV